MKGPLHKGMVFTGFKVKSKIPGFEREKASRYARITYRNTSVF
jgi:hypothetical protein